MNVLKHMMDASLYQAGGRFDCSTQAACAANFPALKHFFPCDETADAEVITDRAGDVALSASAGGSVVLTADSGLITVQNINQLTGAWAAPDDKNVIVLAVGAPTGASVLLCMGTPENTGLNNYSFLRHSCGSAAPTQARVGVAGATGGAVAVPTDNLLAANSTLRGWGMYVDWGGNTQAFYADEEDAVTHSATAAITNLTGISEFTAQGSIAAIGSGAVVGNIQVLHLTSLPSLEMLKAALSFMRAQLAAGADNKFVYPGFYGLS